jgi:hypothetical protein
MSYRVVVEKVETVERSGRKEWKQVIPDPPKEQYQAFISRGDREKLFDYVTDPNIYREEKKTTVLNGEVETVDMPALVALLWPVKS